AERHRYHQPDQRRDHPQVGVLAGQLPDQRAVAGDPGPHHRGGPSWAGCTCSACFLVLPSAAWIAARSWSKVATPSTQPSPSTATACPAGDSTAASRAARSESVPVVKVWPI